MKKSTDNRIVKTEIKMREIDMTKIHKKLLPVLLAICLSVTMAPLSVWAEEAEPKGAEPDICKIGEVGYANLDLALDDVPTGGEGPTTIEILKDIDYEKGMVIENKSVTFALGGYDLNVVNTEGKGLEVTNGTVGYTGEGGEFNVRGTIAGVYVEDSNTAVAVTNAVGTSYGVNASMGKITVNGDVIGDAVGAQAVNGGEVTIEGNVRVLNGDGIGVWALGNYSKVTVEGSINAGKYIKIGEVEKNKSDGESDLDKPGYLKYGSAGDGIVWVLNTACAIGTEEYETLEAALADVLTGGEEPTIISLLKSIDHDQSIVLDNQKITFELNGFILNIDSEDEDHAALDVTNGGCVSLDGDGELNIKGKNGGVFVFSETTPSFVTVTNAEATAVGGYAVQAYGNASITVLEGVTAVDGDGAIASNGANINIGGEVIAGRIGVEAGEDAETTNGASIYVKSNISAGQVGAKVLTGGAITIDGEINETVSQYIIVAGIVKTKKDGVPDTESGYLLYSDSETDSTVRVKAPTYTLTVNSGEGTGNYIEGAVVTITADVAPDGQRFKEWTGADGLEFTEGSQITPTAKFTMPAEAMTLTATYEDIPVSIIGVTVSPAFVSVQKGTTQGFTAIVTGTGAFNDTVTWSVTGGMAGTSINSSGVLTVAADETAGTLTVTAEATGDSSKKGTVTVTVTDAPVIKYALTVNNGSGTGEYADGANVVLTAATPAEDKLFDKWVVTSGALELVDATANPITITMPAEAIIIEAAYKDKPADPNPTYTVTLNSGGSGAAGTGDYIEGAVITIKAGTRSGYTFTGWTSPDEVTFADASSATTTFAMPAKPVTVTANWKYNGGGSSGGKTTTPPEAVPETPPEPEPELPPETSGRAAFTDTASHWAQESIDYVVGKGLFSGTTESKFAPNEPMNRGMLVTVLGRLAGIDINNYQQSSFGDVPAGKYYASYIEWAYKAGIIQGIGGNQFAPDRAITREEIAVIFSNYAKATGHSLSAIHEAAGYRDEEQIGSAYKSAVTDMQQAGIMVGGSDNRFNPKAGATRAETATMLHRYIETIIGPAAN